jgi:hypothetical protein
MVYGQQFGRWIGDGHRFTVMDSIALCCNMSLIHSSADVFRMEIIHSPITTAPWSIETLHAACEGKKR